MLPNKREMFLIIAALVLAACTSAPPRPTLQECLDQSPLWRALNTQAGGVTPEFMEHVNQEIRKCEVSK